MKNKKLKVLVVDDQASARYLVVRVLENKGYLTEEADSAESAVQILKLGGTSFDALVLDWELSGKDGLWLIRWMQNQPGLSLIPVVLLTAYEQERDMAWGIGAGANQYITKPFHGPVLLSMLQSCINRYYQIQNLVVEVSDQPKTSSTYALSKTNSSILNNFFIQSLDCKNRSELIELFFYHVKELSFPSAPAETSFGDLTGQLRISLLLCFGSEKYFSDRGKPSMMDQSIMKHAMVGGSIIAKDQATIIPSGSTALIIRNTPSTPAEREDAIITCQSMLRQMEMVDKKISGLTLVADPERANTQSDPSEAVRFTRMMRFAQQTARLGVIEIDVQTDINFWSQGAKGLLENQSEQDNLDLEVLFQAVHPEDRYLLQSAISDLKIQNRESARLEIRLIGKDQKLRFLQLESQVLLNTAGKVDLVLILLYDITWLKTVENQIRQSYEASKISDHGKSVFLAHLSHEIRTPLNGILGVLQLIDSKVIGEEKSLLAGAKNACKQLVLVLNQLLDLAHSEYQNFELKTVDFRAEKFDLCLPLYQGLAAEKKIQFHVYNSLDKNLRLQSDPSRIQQALSGVLENAFKFTQQGSVTLRISLKQELGLPDQLNFNIQDTGIGIAAEDLERVFLPFIQVDEQASREFEGLGLGLTLSSRLIKALEGEITLFSELGSGSEFNISIPVGVYREGDSRLPAPRRKPIPSLRILLADDNRLNRIVGSKALVKMNHQVHCVENGKEAVQWLLNNPCDLVLMDYCMPVMDGPLAIEAIRDGQALNPKIPIFLVTSSEDVDLKTAKQFQADGLILKPYSVASLTDCFVQILE